MKNMNLSSLAAGILVTAALPQAVMATPISGSISFYGNVTPYTLANGGGSMATTYTSAQSLVFGLTQVAAGANGSFAGIPMGTVVNVNSLGVNPPTLPAPPGTPLWTIGSSFTFTLTSLTEPTVMANVMVLEGTGTITDGIAADTTMGSWVASFTDAVANSGVTFSWNSSSQSTAAPEAGTNVLLMGLGLAGLAAFAKFHKSGVPSLAL